MTEQEELAYLAGFVDGEGSIAIGINKSSSSGKRRWYGRFSVHQVNPAPLILLRDRFGGSIRHTQRAGTQRSIHEWTIVSRKAAAAIRLLLPYLVVKAEEARVLLEFQDLMDGTENHRVALDENQETTREHLYLKLRALKHLEYERIEDKHIPPPQSPKKTRVKVSIPVTGEWKKGKMPAAAILKEQYETNGPTWIAREYKVSRQTVLNWLTKNNIPRLGRTEASEQRRIAGMKNIWQ